MRYTDEALRLVAARARGTPRIANHLLRRTRDVADVQNQGLVDLGVAQRALEMLGLDEAGLSDMDRRILACLARAGRPTGLKTVATLVGEEESTIETAYEPWLLQLGFLIRLPAGRAITERGRDHIRAGGVVLAGDRWESAPDLFSEDLT
jgi:Holliday junction DNA helicase RuvB